MRREREDNTGAASAMADASAPVSSSSSQGVAVFARLRPPNDGEERGDLKIKTNTKSKTLATRNLEFGLDCIFSQDVPQDEVYRVSAQGHVLTVLGGLNA